MTNKDHYSTERCFICGSRIGRGNHPHLPVHERMNKLVSVSQTVEHSSTIISDILSRILNETVMHEETICRICFNLLNDIDYHLKEAQEKTDEITNKFLDKGKDPLSYNPQPIVTASSATSEDTEEEEEEAVAKVDELDKRRRSRGKRGAIGAASRRRLKGLSQTRTPVQSPPPDQLKIDVNKAAIEAVTTDTETEGQLTEDEMTANNISRNKAKLLSQVLNPRKAAANIASQTSKDSRAKKRSADVEACKFTERISDDTEVKTKRRRNVSSSSNLKRRRKRKDTDESEEERTIEERHVQMSRREDEIIASGGGRKSGDPLVTVNMEELDLLSKAPKGIYYARKSEPVGKKLSEKEILQGSMEEKPRCPFCGKTFKRTANLQLHIEKAHEEPPTPVHEQPIPETHRCHLCPREFTNHRSLSAHIAEHEEDKARLARLEEERDGGQPQWSSSPASKVLASSKRRPENNKPPAAPDEAKATCPQCGKTFRRHFNMRIHVDRVHNKVKPFPCKFCDKAFATNSDLRQHIGVHGEGQKFECEECGRSFNNRDSIILHRKQHTNSRTHFCVVCNKGFFKASCLNRHMRSHTGERPFRCSACGKGFSQSTTLKAHQSKCGGDDGEENRSAEYVAV